MRDQFLLNLARALAHSAVLEAQAAEHAPGSVQANLGMSYKTPDAEKVSASTMQAQLDAMRGTGRYSDMGSILSLEREFQPQYTDLALRGIQGYLGGTGQTPGMMDIYRNTVLPGISSLTTAQRSADIADVNRLGRPTMEAARGYNPAVTKTLDTLQNQTGRELALNGALDAFTKRMLQQDFRGGRSARGLGTGMPDAAAEAYYEDATRQQRRLQNQQAASAAASQSAGYYGDPFARILSTGSLGPASAFYGQASGGVSGTGPRLFDPYNQMAMASYAGQSQANQYAAQSRNDLFQQLLGGAFSLGGAGMIGAHI
jgi:hypothetical protein